MHFFFVGTWYRIVDAFIKLKPQATRKFAGLVNTYLTKQRNTLAFFAFGSDNSLYVTSSFSICNITFSILAKIATEQPQVFLTIWERNFP